MKTDKLRDLARRLSFRTRLLMNTVSVLAGLALIVIPYFTFHNTSIWLPTLTGLGSATFGAAFVALVTQVSLTNELQRVDLDDPLHDDAERLGLRRLMADLRDVQNQVPLREVLRDARVVYILGTTITNTARMQGLISSAPATEFRFLYARLPAGPAGDALERAISIIHDQPIRTKIASATEDLAAVTLANVKSQQLSCVPTFSAILAVWEDGRSWLQVDHYLMRTKCDHRVWLTLDSRTGKAELLARYKRIIEDMWLHPEHFDVATALSHGHVSV